MMISSDDDDDYDHYDEDDDDDDDVGRCDSWGDNDMDDEEAQA